MHAYTSCTRVHIHTIRIMREKRAWAAVFYPLALFDQTHASQLKIRSEVSTTLHRCRLAEKPT